MSEHPDDAALLALSESGGTSAHLAGCAACRARVEAARAAASWVRGAAPGTRAFCPPRPLLATREELDPGQRARLDAHAAACPACRAELADFAALLAPAPSTPAPTGAGLLETLRLRLVLSLDAARRGLELLESQLLPLPVPALVPVRGGEAGPTPAAGVGALAPFGGGALELLWVTGADGIDLQARASGAAPKSFRLELGPQDDPAAVWESRSADEGGVVRLDGLAPGAYWLRAYVPQEANPGLELAVELRG